MGKTGRGERAKGTSWREEAQATAAAFDSGAAQPVQQGPSQDPYALVTAHRKALVEFWDKHGQEFGAWWRALPRLEKDGFIRAVSPFTPSKRGDRHVMVSGKREFVGGVANYAPELNRGNLIREGGLLALYQQRVEQARIAAQAAVEMAAGEPVLILVDDLDWQDKQYIEVLVQGSRLPNMEDPLSLAFLVDMGGGRRAGSIMKWTGGNLGQRERLLMSRGVIDANTYLHTRQRQIVILSSLLVFADFWRLEVLGKSQAKFVASAAGCGNCGALEAPGSGKLKYCGRCGIVAYCSPECQREHWRLHKEVCSSAKAREGAEKQQQEEAGSSQATAAQE